MKKRIVVLMVSCLLLAGSMHAAAQTTTEQSTAATTTDTTVNNSTTTTEVATTTADDTVSTTVATTTDTTVQEITTNMTEQVLATTARTRTTIKNGRITTTKVSGVQTTRTTAPLQTLYDTGGVALQAAAGVFPKDAVITVHTTNVSLTDIAKKAVGYTISAVSDDKAVKPDGTVSVTFAIPDGYTPLNTAVVKVNENGTAQILVSRVDAAVGTVTVETDALGTFAVVQLDTAAKKDTTWLSITALLVVLALGISGFLYYRRKTK